MKSKFFIFFSFLVFSVFDTSAFGDEIYLNNGKTLKGMIIGKDSEKVTLEVLYGRITVKRSDISSIKEISLRENYLEFAREYEKRKDIDKARLFLKSALKIDPDFIKAKEALEKLDEEIKSEESQRKDKEEEILRLNELGLQQASKENYISALSHLKKAYILDRKKST